MTMKCEYCQIPGSYGELMHETDHWLIYLAPSQRFLGTCVVALKRQCGNLGELNIEEWNDFIKILNKLEAALDKAFSPTLFNWSCFMNSTFRTDSPEPEVHWHFIPRYKNKVEFEGLTFEDPDFGYIPKPNECKIPENVMEKIMNTIKKNCDF